MINPKLLRPKDVCATCAFSASTLERLLRNPDAEFPKPIRIGANRYWRPESIDAFIARQECATTGEAGGDA